MELGRDRLIADRLTGFERDQRRPACPVGEVGGNLSDLTDNGRRCLRRCQEWIMKRCLHHEALCCIKRRAWVVRQAFS